MSKVERWFWIGYFTVVGILLFLAVVNHPWLAALACLFGAPLFFLYAQRRTARR
jgi:hypothetical protein